MRVPFGILFHVHALRSHAEGKNVHGKSSLAAAVRRSAKGVDFLDHFIGHREAADRNAVAVDHDRAACAIERAVEGIRVADVEGQVKAAVGIHRRGWDGVESLRHLAVALSEFWAERSGCGGDRVAAEKFVAPGGLILDEKFKHPLFLEGANEDFIAKLQIFFREGRLEGRLHPGGGLDLGQG